MRPLKSMVCAALLAAAGMMQGRSQPMEQRPMERIVPLVGKPLTELQQDEFVRIHRCPANITASKVRCSMTVPKGWPSRICWFIARA